MARDELEIYCPKCRWRPAPEDRLGVRAEVRHGLEHLLDARALPGVPEALVDDPVPGVQAVLAAPPVVPPAEPGEGGAAAQARDRYRRLIPVPADAGAGARR